MGKPVVVSNVGSLPEVVWGEYVLVEPRNPKAIAEGVRRVYAGEVTTGKAMDFSWGRCIDGYEKIYEELVGK